MTDYDDTDYGPNNDGVTDYNDTDYGQQRRVTDYNDSAYGDSSQDSNYDDGDSNYDDGGLITISAHVPPEVSPRTKAPALCRRDWCFPLV
ncbi:MAG: hypothetical protein ACLVJ6_02420 [Merdibacter sp.]